MNQVFTLPGSKSNLWIEGNEAEVGLSELEVTDTYVKVPRHIYEDSLLDDDTLTIVRDTLNYVYYPIDEFEKIQQARRDSYRACVWYPLLVAPIPSSITGKIPTSPFITRIPTHTPGTEPTEHIPTEHIPTEHRHTPGTEQEHTPGTEQGHTPGTEHGHTPGTEHIPEKHISEKHIPTEHVHIEQTQIPTAQSILIDGCDKDLLDIYLTRYLFQNLNVPKIFTIFLFEKLVNMNGKYVVFGVKNV